MGRLGWPLRRIEEATGVRRETAGDYLRSAGIVVRSPGTWGPKSLSKAATLVTTGFFAGSGPPGPVGRRSSCSSEPDVLTPDEFNRLVQELPQRERVMVLLAGTTGLQRSELIALTWQDVDFKSLQLEVKRACVNGQVGTTKTRASARPVPLHPSVASALQEWRSVTLFPSSTDFLFASTRSQGKIPVRPDTLLRKVIRPAAIRAGILNKVIGWHTFRHSLGTILRFLGVDIKTAQELLRHANSRITLDLYSQAVSSQKREANAKVVRCSYRLRPLISTIPNQRKG